jgi:hypothetical protein
MSGPGRTTRPRKASTAGAHPPTSGLQAAVVPETSTPSAIGGSTSVPPLAMSSGGPLTIADCEALVAQLLDPSIGERTSFPEGGRANDHSRLEKEDRDRYA